jgi:hypothetical protein
MSGRPVVWALGLYPKWWRERYGAEVRDLTDELLHAGRSTPRRAAADLVISAARERSPRRPSRRVLAVMGVATLCGLVASMGGFVAVTALSSPATPRPLASEPVAQLVVFIQPGASAGEIAALQREMVTSQEQGRLRSCRYTDKAQAYREFVRMFRDQPAMVRMMTVDQTPPSLRCVLGEVRDVARLAEDLDKQPGVLNTDYPGQVGNGRSESRRADGPAGNLLSKELVVAAAPVGQGWDGSTAMSPEASVR